jgi:hypothetical protein
MPTKSTEELLIEMEEKQRKCLARSIKRGGLPTEAEAEAVTEQLIRAFSDLESLAFRVEGIAAAPGDFAVSLNQIGAVAMLLTDADEQIEALQHEAQRLRKSMPALLTLRAEERRQELLSRESSMNGEGAEGSEHDG